jgi:integrase
MGAHRIEEIRRAIVFGIRPTRTFREAATKYLTGNLHKRSIQRDALDLRTVDPFIGDLALNRVHDGTLQEFVRIRLRRDRVAVGTVNRSLAVVRRVLNLAARKWRDEQGMTWLETLPLIELLPDEARRRPYPLSWQEQRLLFSELPPHLARMALFKVNTGNPGAGSRAVAMGLGVRDSGTGDERVCGAARAGQEQGRSADRAKQGSAIGDRRRSR